MTKNKAKALYIHIPFCNEICDYCDFQKLQYFRNIAQKYLSILFNELHNEVVGEVSTIYIGGGTPTALDDDLFEELLKEVSKYSHGQEFTVEANPESLSVTKISLMKKYGVNRVSIGVESTNDEILKSINRHHGWGDVRAAVKNLRDAGINNINLDLILGLPNVSIKMLEKDIKNILLLKPNHISCYSLTVHEHTVFFLNGITEPTEEFSYEAYKMVDTILKDASYEHYEVSNWSLPEYRSEHNLTYWRNEEYYGLGLGASGYIKDQRYKNTTNLDSYLKGENNKEIEVVNLSDKAEYQVMLNLRTLEGLNLEEFKKEYGYDLYEKNKGAIDSFIKDGYLTLEGNILRPTFEGMMILDHIILKLI